MRFFRTITLALGLIQILLVGGVARAEDPSTLPPMKLAPMAGGPPMRTPNGDASAVKPTSGPAASETPITAGPAATVPSATPTTTTPTTPAAVTGAPVTGAAVTEIKPEVFYIRDKENHLVPVPNFTYDDFVKYYRLKEQLDRPEQKPRYNLQQLAIDGTTTGDRAELTVLLKVLTTDSGWVRVPLRMNKCALRESVEYKGSGDQLMQFDPAGDGYVCWLRGSLRGEHELTLKFLAPLTATSGENRLELQLPRAAASKLTLQVPIAAAVATVAPGAAAPEVTVAKQGSQIATLGLGGDFWVAWRAADRPGAQLSGALEANGQLLVRIDGRSASTDATLTVRSFGAEFDHFQVRLPPGAQLVGRDQSAFGYTLAPSGANSSLVDVKLDRKTAGPVDVRLTTERAYDVTKSNENLDLAGFAVTEAIPHRQWGHLAVAVSGDWQLIWGERTRIRQVDELPEPLKRRDVMAGFEYFGQPSSLMVRVQPRKTRIGVEPAYTYRIRTDRVDLDAKLKYTIRGARLFKLDIDLQGWELDRVTPENLVDLDSISTGPGTALSIPLAQPATGELELSFQAHRSLAGAKGIDLVLPEPAVDVLSPAEVTILAAANVELSPISNRVVGLTRVAGGFRPDLKELGATALYYRAEQPRAEFVADLTARAQAISVDLDNRIALRRHDIEINQTLNYQIRYEPLDHLTFDVPRSAFDERRLKFAVNGESIDPVEVAEQPSAQRRSVQIALPRPVLGPVRVEAHIQLNQESLTTTSSTPIDLPLVVPLDGQVAVNTATVTADPSIRIEQREGPWSVADPMKMDSGAQTGMRLTTSGSVDSIRLAESLDERRIQGTTFIDRAWVQCWLTNNVRQDRAIYNFTSTEDQLRIQLPAGIGLSDTELFLDSKPLNPLAGPNGALAIALSSDAGRREHLLELRYQFDGRGPGGSWLTLETPRFENHVKIRREYLQLVLPADEHLVFAAAGVTPEYDWRWRDYGLGVQRVSLKEQRQLEQWVGLDRGTSAAESTEASDADRRSGEVPARSNRYLFSSAGAEPRFEVLIARRWLILLIGSLIPLSIGMAVMYVAALRQTRIVLAACGAGLLVALIWPEPVLMLAQAAAVGVGLLPVAIWLRWLSIRPTAVAAPTSSGLHSTIDRNSKQLIFGAGHSHPTPSTASISVGTAGQGSNS